MGDPWGGKSNVLGWGDLRTSEVANLLVITVAACLKKTGVD